VFLHNSSYAPFCHPVTGKGVCTAFARNEVLTLLNNNQAERAEELKRHYGFKKDLVIRAEQVFYYELVKLVPALTSLRRVLDETVLSKLCGKRKKMSDPRPDYFHFSEKTNTAILGEFDETSDHEDDQERLELIAHQAGCGRARTFVFRVNGRLGEDRPLCVRRERQGVVFYCLTDAGREVLWKVAAYVRSCLPWVLEGGSLDPALTQTVYF